MQARPDFSRCYGITHMPDGAPIVREPKLLKVGIGVPKGKGIHALMSVDDHDKLIFKVLVGTNKQNTVVTAFTNKKEAEAFYMKELPKAPERKFPVKLPYFTFSRQLGDGSMVADFDAIEAHGIMPTEIDIIFLSDDPLEASYAMWSVAELRCKGDGLNAMRIASMAKTDTEKAAVDGRYFPIVEGCATKGCPFSKGEPPACKPSGDLKFQLANNLRVGGTAYFHTTGYRSISQLFSALQVFKTLTGGGNPEIGRIAGIPFRFTVRPYQTKHNGQVATQYGVGLEFRAETVTALRSRLIEQATEFRTLVGAAAPQRQIAAPADDIVIVDEDYGDESAQAAALNNEFLTATVVDDEPTPVVDKVPERTEAAKTDLKERLRSRTSRGKFEAGPEEKPLKSGPVVAPLEIAEPEPEPVDITAEFEDAPPPPDDGELF